MTPLAKERMKTSVVRKVTAVAVSCHDNNDDDDDYNDGGGGNDDD